MLAILLGLFRLIWLFGRSQDAVALENLALRQQLAIYKRKKKRPRLIRRQRWFWIVLGRTLEEAWKARSTVNRQGDPRADSNHGSGESLVASSAHSRRVAETRNSLSPNG